MPVISALMRQRLEDLEFKPAWIAKPCLKNTKTISKLMNSR
jgi:hypothetical protein